MKTYPLKGLSIEAAQKKQFELIDIITQNFRGDEILSLGDLGVVSGLNKPTFTKRVEDVLANYFGVERAMFVRGAGTGALRFGFMSYLQVGDQILVHDAPIYPTSKTTLEAMGVKPIVVDFHKLDEVRQTIEAHPKIKGVLIQLTRQKMNDSYDFAKVIQSIKSNNPSLIIITDDNYAAMKVKNIGVQVGADLSTFSLFKLLGPVGVGLILGKEILINRIEKMNYSGGSQVQGYEAMEALRGLIYSPVMLAVQAGVNEQLLNQLNNGLVEGVKQAFIANAQSKVLMVEFKEPIAKDVLRFANELGAAPNPIGAESKYEFVPMFYRVSSTVLSSDPLLEHKMIRINPLRSGPDTIIRILTLAIQRAKKIK